MSLKINEEKLIGIFFYVTVSIRKNKYVFMYNGSQRRNLLSFMKVT